MNRVEELLLQMSLREPPDDLDQRVGESIAPALTRPPHDRRPSWVGILAACGACLLIGVLFGNQWRGDPGDTVSRPPVATSTDIRGGTGADESPSIAPPAVLQDVPEAVELAAVGTASPGSRTMVSEGTFLLINGEPVRRHGTFQTRHVRVYSDETGRFHEIEIPVRRDVAITSLGI